MARPKTPELTDRELAVMQVFWQTGECTAEQARQKLLKTGEDVAYVTIANVVRGLRDEITNIAKETDMSDDDFAKHLLEQWKKIKVSIVNGKEVNGEEAKDYMLVEGECSGSLIKALSLSKMFKAAE